MEIPYYITSVHIQLCTALHSIIYIPGPAAPLPAPSRTLRCPVTQLVRTVTQPCSTSLSSFPGDQTYDGEETDGNRTFSEVTNEQRQSLAMRRPALNRQRMLLNALLAGTSILVLQSNLLCWFLENWINKIKSTTQQKLGLEILGFR